ncbi:MAG: T9SS type A sorting domain-containing protein [Chitinophagales bacterium]|nr:T9SS type A sorting domain-containing protein [Chitinophagales bacterium]
METNFMRKYTLALMVLASVQIHLQAQNLYVPDPAFRAYLQANFSSCMPYPDSINVPCASAYSGTINVSNLGIQSLEGIQAFSNLSVLICSSNQLTSLPVLPSTLWWLDCSGNQLTNLPALPGSMQKLYCNNNQLTNLPTLPAYLLDLICSYNQLTNLPSLPGSLERIKCNNNQLTSLPVLPNSLITLDCSNNQLAGLPNLPVNIVYLSCYNNQLTSLPALPGLLKTLDCSNNQITNLPNLPIGLENLYCDYNQLTSLPALSDSLQQLFCNFNQLTSLPSLPDGLWKLYCSNNQLTNLPALPSTLDVLGCSNNQLSGLPYLPDTMAILLCGDNLITCFPRLPHISNGSISLLPNPIACLPNYVQAMDANHLAYPICTTGNPNGCPEGTGILGTALYDANGNCQYDGNADSKVANVEVSIYDSNNNFWGITNTFVNGVYMFHQGLVSGNYTLKVDTANKPYIIACNAPIQQSVTFQAGALTDSVDFLLACKPGFDVGVQSVNTAGWVFPGQTHTLSINAGDISNIFYQLACAQNVSGQILVQVSGPVTYAGAPSGAILPTSISGNSFTYSIADFSTLMSGAIGLLFTTDTTAQAGDQVCVNISVTPVTGDNNPANNTYSWCYDVVNSYDPNRKDVYPNTVQPGYDGWLTYTIYFQNTGSAPAFNIKLIDTLSALLDPSTFELLGYSHKCTYELRNSVVKFFFSNIMLPDSASNPEGSIGFVQFRIKPLQPLSLNQSIPNRAGIYFDFNAPIITNTATIIAQLVVALAEEPEPKVWLYPVPCEDNLHIAWPSGAIHEIRVIDITGKAVVQQSGIGQGAILSLKHLSPGVYMVKMRGVNGKEVTRRIVKQ